MKDKQFFIDTITPIISTKGMQSTKKLTQHGYTSVFAHSVAVAAYSVMLADRLGVRVNKKSLIRGAALHDYFLYDWHKTSDIGDGLHGFMHPFTASKNAVRHFRLNKREVDIIRKHMWPLTLTKFPIYTESWLVCIVDKYLSVLETLKINKYGDDTFLK